MSPVSTGSWRTWTSSASRRHTDNLDRMAESQEEACPSSSERAWYDVRSCAVPRYRTGSLWPSFTYCRLAHSAEIGGPYAVPRRDYHFADETQPSRLFASTRKSLQARGTWSYCSASRTCRLPPFSTFAGGMRPADVPSPAKAHRVVPLTSR